MTTGIPLPPAAVLSGTSFGLKTAVDFDLTAKRSASRTCEVTACEKRDFSRLPEDPENLLCGAH